MKIFVLDTSSKAASAAVWEDGHLLADCWQNTGRTHSVTSLPMAENLLADCSRTLEEMDALGSHSRTGVLYRTAHRYGDGQGHELCPGQALYPPLHSGGAGLESPAGPD